MTRMLGRFSVLVLGATCLMFAQRGGGGGGHHSGGGGFGGGHSSFHSSVSSSNASGFNMNVNPNGIRSNSDGFNMNIQTGNINSRPVFVSPASRPRPPINGPRPVYGGYKPSRSGYYVGFGWYPYFPLGFYDDSYYNAGYQSEAPYSQPYMDQPQQEPVYQYPPPVPYQQVEPQAQVSEPVQPAPPMVLVLKNGQKLQVQSYAIMNGVLWDFTKANPKRIALGDVDVSASAKATDEAGGAFPAESFGANPN